MNTRFLPLFTFGITHQYYGGGGAPCPDFEFVIAEHSQRALAGARLLTRIHGGRLHVLFEANEKKSPRQDIDGMELVIGLRLRNPYFGYFTGALPEQLPLYANASAPTALDAPQACDLIARSFEPAAALAQRPLALSINRMQDDALMWSGKIRPGEDMPKIDMRSWQAGCYLATQRCGSETRSRPLILAPDLADAGMWGAVRIVVTPDFWNSPPPPADPAGADFTVGFNACAETLDYYIVAPADWSDFEKLSVTDASRNSTLAFSKLVQTPTSDDGIPPAVLGLPDKQAVLFRSSDPVTRSAASSLRLQLKHNGNTLVNNLPLPGADMPSARFVIHLSKP